MPTLFTVQTSNDQLTIVEEFGLADVLGDVLPNTTVRVRMARVTDSSNLLDHIGGPEFMAFSKQRFNSAAALRVLGRPHPDATGKPAFPLVKVVDASGRWTLLGLTDVIEYVIGVEPDQEVIVSFADENDVAQLAERNNVSTDTVMSLAQPFKFGQARCLSVIGQPFRPFPEPGAGPARPTPVRSTPDLGVVR